MIRVTITPKERENIYGMMVQKEVVLRQRNQGTLHRIGRKKRDEDKWVHASFNGWITFQRSLGGIVVALVQARNPNDEWQLLTSFIGFLDRQLRDSISAINLSYEPNEL